MAAIGQHTGLSFFDTGKTEVADRGVGFDIDRDRPAHWRGSKRRDAGWAVLADAGAEQIGDLERTAVRRSRSPRRMTCDRWPSSDTVPWSGGYMLDIRLNAVVLPAPLGPIRACSVRSVMEMSTPWTALMPPKLLTMWWADSTGPSTWDVGRRNSGSGSTSMRRADIAASSTSFLRNGASSRSPTPTRPVGENTMKATNTRPNQNSQFSV